MASAMAYEAKIMLDSLNPFNGARLTTMQVSLPRFIWDEMLTHRMFSRNASSTRAVPVAKMIEQVINDPVIPIQWGKNRPGMTASDEISDKVEAEKVWLLGRDSAVFIAQSLLAMQAHKQVINPVLMPYSWITAVITATEWANFFKLRNHKDARPEMERIASMMYSVYETSLPVKRSHHIPYWDSECGEGLIEGMWRSVARCCRVSTLRHDGTPATLDEDHALYVRERAEGHWSPFEHQATALNDKFRWSGNFRGWQQYRKEFSGESGE